MDEAIRLIRDAVPDPKITLAALHPHSFRDLRDLGVRVLNPFNGEAGSSRFTVLRSLVLQQTAPAVEELKTTADLVVAVGGGYLRGRSVRESLKTLAAHGPQLPVMTQAPTVYLPQSIGPTNLITRRAFRKLRNADVVYVRDDRSLKDLERLGVSGTRSADIAALEIAQSFSQRPLLAPEPNSQVGLVGRHLPPFRSGSYRRTFRALSALPGTTVLTQSTGRGNDDPKFYNSLGLSGPWNAVGSLAEEDSPVRVVVSVRLHGSLQAMMMGVPSIHLAYERKGFGVFSDLNLDDFVWNARSLDMRALVEQIEQVRADPTAYWSRVATAVPNLRAQRRDLVESIAHLVS